MKIGEYKIKRNYQIIQMVVDAFAVILLVVIVQCTLAFREQVLSRNELIQGSSSAIDTSMLVSWVPNIVWAILAIVFVGVSIFFTFKNRNLPKKYKINKENAQKYSDIVITAITCIRIPVLLGIFDMMYIHQQRMMYQNESLFSLQVLLDALLIVIIIRFSMHRVRAIEPKDEEKSHEIIQG